MNDNNCNARFILFRPTLRSPIGRQVSRIERCLRALIGWRTVGGARRTQHMTGARPIFFNFQSFRGRLVLTSWLVLRMRPPLRFAPLRDLDKYPRKLMVSGLMEN